MVAQFIRKLMLIPFICLTGTAQAAIIGFNPSDSGQFNHIIQFFPSDEYYENTQDPLSRIITDYDNINVGFVWSAAYLVFDLQSLPFNALSGTLQFDFRASLGPEFGNLSLYSLDTVQPADLAALTPGEQLPIAAGQPIWDDLAGGPLLAPVEVGEEGPVSFDLNATALSQINAAGGLWGLGIRWTSTPIASPIIGLELQAPPLLTLSDSVSGVPVPGTLALALLGLALLGYGKVRND